jgi:uncharacterized protein
MEIQKEYRERTYRDRILKNNLKSFNVTIRESDLFVSTDLDLEDVTRHSVYQYRSYIESYIEAHPDFLTSLVPLPCDEFAPAIVRDMMTAAIMAGVGPMAAVAGAIAEHVGRDLLQYSRNVIIENGGDIFIQTQNDIHVGIFAGNSPLSEHISLHVSVKEMPVGVCTSSGTVGHSLSFGNADAVCVKAKSVALADAAATAIGNRVKTKQDIYLALQEGMKIKDILGMVIILADHFGAIGDVELVNS